MFFLSGKEEDFKAAFLKENHYECFKDLKMGLGAKDLKMGCGPKLSGSFLKETKTMGAVEAEKFEAVKPKGKTPVSCILIFLFWIFIKEGKM